MSDIIMELRQDIAQEKYKEIWRKYGKRFIVSVVAIIFVLIGYLFYTNYQTDNSYKVSALYQKYIDAISDGEISRAESLYQEIVDQDKGKIFSILAKLHATNEMKIDNIEVSYNRSSNYQYYKELLKLKEFKGEASVEDDFVYLNKEYNLLKAFYAIESGDLEGAKDSFAMILVDPEASEQYQQLAMEFINYLDERKVN